MADLDNGRPDPQTTALRAQREDAKVALAWFTGTAWARIEEKYHAIRDRYERLLHDPNIDSTQRDRACFAVMVADEFLGVQSFCERQLKSAEAKLVEIEQEGKRPEKVWDRILTFMR